MKTLHESLLDDENDIISGHKSIVLSCLKDLDNKFRKNNNFGKTGYDWLGQKLSIGDLVIFPRVGFCAPGIILDMNDKGYCLISMHGDIEKHKNSRGEIPEGAFHKNTWEVMKINDKILIEIYKLMK